MLNQTAVAACVDAIINARDFCGNENEACRDTLHDHGITDRQSIGEHMIAAFNEANQQWDKWRAKAEVKRKSRPRDFRALS